MADVKSIVAEARKLLVAEAVIVTACDVKDGVIDRVQL